MVVKTDDKTKEKLIFLDESINWNKLLYFKIIQSCIINQHLNEIKRIHKNTVYAHIATVLTWEHPTTEVAQDALVEQSMARSITLVAS